MDWSQAFLFLPGKLGLKDWSRTILFWPGKLSLKQLLSAQCVLFCLFCYFCSSKIPVGIKQMSCGGIACGESGICVGGSDGGGSSGSSKLIYEMICIFSTLQLHDTCYC